MSSVNRVLLVGNVGSEPELRAVGDQQKVAFSLATSHKWRDRSGEMQERTEWHRVIAWGKTAENCAAYTSKGDLIYVEGAIESRDFEHNGQQRKAYEIRAGHVRSLTKKGGRPREEQQPYSPRPPSISRQAGADDIPF